LFYSFRGSDPIAENILRLDHREVHHQAVVLLSCRRTEHLRRLFMPSNRQTLDSLPGDKHIYLPWQQLHQLLRQVLTGVKKVAMQYSPLNTIPYISRVDAGTVELIRSLGVEVVTSADLVQVFEAVWDDEQLDTHLYAAKHMREIVDEIVREVGRRVREGVSVTEVEIQDFIVKQVRSTRSDSRASPDRCDQCAQRRSALRSEPG
jgi:Xaa-Pro aminopeptidase